MFKKRGQSAMEFLMTYGWAILVVLIVLAGLYFLGVFSPKGVSICNIQAPFVCRDFAVKENGVVFSLGAGNIQSGNVDRITVNGEECIILDNNLKSNQIINIECGGLDLSNVNKIKADIEVTYSTKSGLSHNIKGEGSGSKEGGVIVGHVPLEENVVLALNFEGYREELGNEILNDGGLENWNNPNDLTNWGEYAVLGSTVNQESVDKYEGNYAARLDVSPRDGNVFISQGNVFEQGKRYKITFWAKGSENDFRMAVNWRDNEGRYYPIATPSLTTNYQEFEYIFVFVPNGNGRIELGRLADGGAAGKSIYIDGIRLKEVSLFVDDESVNNNDGTCNGNSCPTFTENGKVGGAFEFDGVNDYFRVPHNANLNPGINDFSLSAWIKSSSLTSQKFLYKFTGPGYIFHLYRNDGLRVRLNLNGLNYLAPVSIADGNWHYVVLSVDRESATGFKIFADGSQVGVSQDPRNIGDVNPIGDLFISSDAGGSEFFNGIIDELRIFNTALGEDEILAHYLMGRG